jgi:hypothetical protein
MAQALFLMGLLAVAAGCSCAGGKGTDDGGGPDCTGTEECSDQDGDGAGIGRCCPNGDDCDDFNPEITDQCGTPEFCAEHEQGTGCDCDRNLYAEPQVCYEGPDDTAGVAPCRPGLRSCDSGGRWSPCEGQIFPRAEVCDEFDNDCNGDIDNGVTNACGTCGESDCTEVTLGDEDNPWDCENNGDGSLACEDGGLTLDESSSLRSYIWIPIRGATYTEAQVTKINTRTWEEEGRYKIAPSGGYIGGVSTNIEFDVVVTGSYYGGSPRVTRVNGNPSNCGSGDTSTGPTDVLDFGDDACMAWSTEVTTSGFGYGVTNLAWEYRDVLDGRQYFIWVVNNGGQKIFEMNEDGEQTDREVVVSPAYPGAIAFDRDGDLWVADSGSASAVLTEVDTVEAEIIRTVSMPGWTCLCMSADPENNLWVTGSGGPGYILDQEEETAYTIGIPYGVGLAVSMEDYGWFGGSDGKVYRADHSDGLDSIVVDTFDVGLTAGGYGYGAVYTAIDIDEQVWAMNQGNTLANVFPPDDPDSYETAVDDLAGPGACGDMTGTQIAHFFERRGTYDWTIPGCTTGGGEFAEVTTAWGQLRYEADTPGASRIIFQFRTADSVELLGDADFETLGVAPTDDSPFDIAESFDDGSIGQVRIMLEADDDGAIPTLNSVGLSRSCPPGIT